MQLDKQKLALLLSLPDDALREVLTDVAREAGVDPKVLGLDLTQLKKVRAALAGATDADLAAIQKMLEEQGRKGRM